MNKDNCEYYDYCWTHELCEECVAVQIMYDRNGYTAVGIEAKEYDTDVDDGEVLPF